MIKEIESGLKILIVDNDPESLKPINMMLKNIGYQKISGMSSIKEAEEQLGSASPVPLVFINWDMEDGEAQDFVKRILEKEATRSLDIIMETQSNDQETILNAVKLGVKQCLLRPILPNAIEKSLIWIMKSKCEKSKAHLQKVLEEINQSNLGEEEEQGKRNAAYNEALQKVTEAVDFFPWNALPHYEAGLLHNKLGSLNEAVNSFEIVLSLQPKHSDACIALASTYRKRKQWNQMIRVLLNFTSANSSAIVQEHLGEAYLMTGETNKAIKAFNDAIHLDDSRKKNAKIPDRNLAKTHESLGKAYQEKADETKDKKWQERAINSFEESVHFDPILISAHLHLVSAYKKNGDEEKATAELRKVAEITPNSPEDWISLGKMYLMDDEEPKALFALKRALETSQDRQLTLFEIGDALANFDSEKAIAAFNNSLKINREQPHVLNKLGILYRKKGMIEEALEAYLQAISLDEKDETIHYNLAGAYLANSDNERSRKEAISHLKTAIELKKDFTMAKELLAQLEK